MAKEAVNINVGGLHVAVAQGWAKLAQEKLGPAIRDDAKRYCPARTGALRDSIEDEFNPDTGVLRISATGNDERMYAAFVELGHMVYHPSTGQVGPERVAPEPFLRPALYQERDLG